MAFCVDVTRDSAALEMALAANKDPDAAVARARERARTTPMFLLDAYDAERQRLLAGGPGVAPGEGLTVLGQAHGASPMDAREAPALRDSGSGPAPARRRRGLAGLGLEMALLPR